MGRIRRSAADAREHILDAAEAHLGRHGPDSLRLVQLAKELKISHPTILHHFGSREGLIQAVVERTARRLEAQVLESMRKDPDDAAAVSLMERLFRALSDEGHARLLVWLYLAGPGGDPIGYGPRIRLIAEAMHAKRRAAGSKADFEDTMFTVMLGGLALFGNAIAGESLRKTAGLGAERKVNAKFIAWLARLLRGHLEA